MRAMREYADKKTGCDCGEKTVVRAMKTKTGEWEPILTKIYLSCIMIKIQRKGSALVENHSEKDGLPEGYEFTQTPAKKSPEGESLLACSDSGTDGIWHDGNGLSI